MARRLLLRVGACGDAAFASEPPASARRPALGGDAGDSNADVGDTGSAGDPGDVDPAGAGDTGGAGAAGGGGARGGVGLSCAPGALRLWGAESTGPDKGGNGDAVCPGPLTGALAVPGAVPGGAGGCGARGPLAPASEDGAHERFAAGPRIPSRTAGVGRTGSSGSGECGDADAGSTTGAADSTGSEGMVSPAVKDAGRGPLGEAGEAVSGLGAGGSALPPLRALWARERAESASSRRLGLLRSDSRVFAPVRRDRRVVRVRHRVTPSTSPASSPLRLIGVSRVSATRAVARPSPGVVVPSAVTTRAPTMAVPGVLPVHARTMMTVARSSRALIQASAFQPARRWSATGGAMRITRSMTAAHSSSRIVGRPGAVERPAEGAEGAEGAAVAAVLKVPGASGNASAARAVLAVPVGRAVS